MQCRTKYRTKKHFCRYCLQCFAIKRLLIENEETCLKINIKQRVKLKSGTIKFKTYFQQLPVPFAYLYLYLLLVSVHFVFKLVYVDDKLIKSVALYVEKNS